MVGYVNFAQTDRTINSKDRYDVHGMMGSARQTEMKERLRNQVGTRAKEAGGEAELSTGRQAGDAAARDSQSPKSTTPAADRLADARTSFDASQQESKQDQAKSALAINSKFPLLTHRLSNDSFASYFTAESHLFSSDTIDDDAEESLEWKPAQPTMLAGSRDRSSGRIGTEESRRPLSLVRGDSGESARELRREQARSAGKASRVEEEADGTEEDDVGNLPQLEHRRASVPSSHSTRSSTVEADSPSFDSASRWSSSRRASTISDYTAFTQSQAAVSKPTLAVAYVPQSIFAAQKKNRPLTDLITLPRFNSLSRLLKKSSPSPPSSPRSTSNSKRKGTSNDILDAAIASSASAPRGGHGHRQYNALLESAITDPLSNRSGSFRATSISSASTRSSVHGGSIPANPRRVSAGGGIQEESN